MGWASVCVCVARHILAVTAPRCGALLGEIAPARSFALNAFGSGKRCTRAVIALDRPNQWRHLPYGAAPASTKRHLIDVVHDNK
jgi:hypothetical protein